MLMHGENLPTMDEVFRALWRIAYGLVPIMMWIASPVSARAGTLFSGGGKSISASIPTSFSAFTSAVAAGSSFGLLGKTITIPTGPRIWPIRTEGPALTYGIGQYHGDGTLEIAPETDCIFQPERQSVTMRFTIKFDPGSNGFGNASCPVIGGQLRSYGVPLNVANADSIRRFWSSMMLRGPASRFASKICWSNAMIFSCCWSLIASSNTNREIVQIDSIMTPTITNHFAARWTRAGYSGDSNIIPAPTAAPASTLPASSSKWGQNGSAVPASNAPTYVGIAAILTWAVALCLALWRLTSSLLSLWRERRQ
jgi:hypothetical protein